MASQAIPKHASTRTSTTTFSSGASLTIAKNESSTLIARHPRAVSIRRAENRAKSLLTTVTHSAPQSEAAHTSVKAFFTVLAIGIPLIPIALHVLHGNELITLLAHLPAAVLCLLLLCLLTLYPHRPYLAITPTHVVHRPRGLSSPHIYPLTILRSFTHRNNLIVADTLAPKIRLKAPDEQTASAAVQALNTALSTHQRKAPDDLLPTPGQLVVTQSTPLPPFDLPCEKLKLVTKGDRLNIYTLPPRFPLIALVFLTFFLTHAISTVLLIFIFDDLQRSITPINASIITAIALAAIYLLTVFAFLVWYAFNSIPKKWKLLVVGFRKDVTTGMIDIGKCREVVLLRHKQYFGVRIVSTTGNNFLDLHGLSEGEALNLAFIKMQTPASTSTASDPYKIGFCLAGAATGGAYSAGVMDFLLEALTAWDREKNTPNPDPSIPQWDVALTEIIGTSAGGITSTLAVNALNTGHEPLPRDYELSSSPPENNALYRVWVHEAHYENMLKTSDLDNQEPYNTIVSSFFYADYMKEAVSKVLSPPVIHKNAPAWAKDLYLSLTTTNLRGVPYSVRNIVDRKGGSSTYHMRKYADYSQFRVTTDPSTISDTEGKQNRVIDLSAERSSDSWEPAVACARATATYPIAFPSVALETPRSDYDGRLELSPDWKKDASTADEGRTVYKYAAVDGGVVNNEPFGILIDNMEHRNQKQLEAEPHKSWGSVILVDPFPSTQVDPQLVEEGMPVMQTITSLFSATRGEASFKEDEINAALSDTSLEKFMIAPKTISSPSQMKELATGKLGTFSGILDARIPHHDFVLGRANCQYFLQNVFVMKRSDMLRNAIFKDHLENITDETIPIIPVVGRAKEPIQLPEWPAFGEQEKEAIIERVMAAIDKRMQKVFTVYLQNLGIIKDYSNLGLFNRVGQFGTRAAARLIEGRLRDELKSKAEAAVREAMDFYD